MPFVWRSHHFLRLIEPPKVKKKIKPVGELS